MPTEHTVTLPAHTKGKMGAIGDVFGGGNAAQVMGNTTVNIGTLSDNTFVSLDDNPATTETDESKKPVLMKVRNPSLVLTSVVMSMVVAIMLR